EHTGIAVVTGTRDVELVVERYRLTIDVHDEDGVPLPAAQMSIKHTGGAYAGNSQAGTVHHYQKVSPGSTLEISASVPGLVPAEAVVEIAHGEYEKQVDLVLSETSPPTGTLEVVL